MADRILDPDFRRGRTILEEDLHRIGDRALFRIEIVLRPRLVFDALHFRAQRIDARIGCHLVLVVAGGERALHQADRRHVLNAVIAIGGVVQRAFLVDDPDRRFVCGDHDFLDVVQAVTHMRMQPDCALDSRLRVKLGGERNLEQDMFHDVGAIRARELEWLPFEEHVVKTPGRCGERGGITHLAFQGHECQAHAAARGIACRPRFARARVRRVAIGAQRLPVDPCIGDGVHDLLVRAAEHVCDDGRGRDLHQHDVIEADTVEAVLQRDDALDLVRLDHAGEHVAHDERRLAGGHTRARNPVGCREYAAQVVGRMAPFGGEPRVVKIQPADHRADVECGHHRIELVGRARHPGAVRHDRARHDRAHKLGAGGIGEGLESAAERVHQTQARGVVGFGAFDFVLRDVIGDVDQDCVRIGPNV